MTEAQILKLRPTFTLGHMTMVDWFNISQGAGFYSIRSGLRHADGETKSPYYFELTLGGRGSKKRCVDSFSEWYYSLK